MFSKKSGGFRRGRLSSNKIMQTSNNTIDHQHHVHQCLWWAHIQSRAPCMRVCMIELSECE